MAVFEVEKFGKVRRVSGEVYENGKLSDDQTSPIYCSIWMERPEDYYAIGRIKERTFVYTRDSWLDGDDVRKLPAPPPKSRVKLPTYAGRWWYRDPDGDEQIAVVFHDYYDDPSSKLIAFPDSTMHRCELNDEEFAAWIGPVNTNPLPMPFAD